MNICIIGGGFIGSTIARELEKMDEIGSILIVDRYRERVEELAKGCKKVSYAPDLGAILDDVGLVVESASQDAVGEYAPSVLESGTDLVVLSVGAFVDLALFEKCKSLAEEHDCKLYVPSGAVAGTDGLKSASVGRIDEVILISYKPPSALKDVEYLQKKGIDLDAIERATTVFNSREWVSKRPR
jgi:aspartate dehydrogenase